MTAPPDALAVDFAAMQSKLDAAMRAYAAAQNVGVPSNSQQADILVAKFRNYVLETDSALAEAADKVALLSEEDIWAFVVCDWAEETDAGE